MRFSSLTQFRNVLLRVSFDIDFQESVRIVKKKGKNHLTVRDCALDKDLKTGAQGRLGRSLLLAEFCTWTDEVCQTHRWVPGHGGEVVVTEMWKKGPDHLGGSGQGC